MSELRVLRGDPRHKVEEFRKEILGRAALVVDMMGPELRRLIGTLMERLNHLKTELFLINMSGFKVEQTTWTKDGQLWIRWDFDRPQPPDPELYHEVIDAFVDDCLKVADVPEELRRELGGFLRGMATQFAVLAKHTSVDLRKITFEKPRWLPGLTLAFDVMLDGKPMRPRDVGW